MIMSDFTALNSQSEVGAKVDDFMDGIPSMSPDEFLRTYGDKYQNRGRTPDYLIRNILSFGRYGKSLDDAGQKMYDFNLQKYFKNIDVKLANSEIQRRVRDAIAAGVNPVFALGDRGAGDANSGVNGSTQDGYKSNNLIKLMMILFGLVRFLA